MELAGAVAIGLLFGSFTNVLIARVPAGEEWVRGSSRCPTCRHDLSWYDNIPLASWLWLRRKCRHCSTPISARYPSVELMVAGLFLLIALVYEVTLVSVALCFLAVISVALAFIDVDVQRLPDSLVLPAYPIVLSILIADSGVTHDWWKLANAGVGMLVVGGFYGLMWLAYPAGLGFGDVKCAGLLGLVGGYLGWASLVVGTLAGPLLGGLVVAVGLATGRIGRRSRVPYGPFLIGGAWLGYLAGHAVADFYLGLVTSN